MKKIRFFLLTIILTFSFGSMVSAEMVGEKLNPDQSTGYSCENYVCSYASGSYYYDYYYHGDSYIYKAGDSLYVFYSKNDEDRILLATSFDNSNGDSKVEWMQVWSDDDTFLNGRLHIAWTGLGRCSGYYYDAEFDSYADMVAYITDNQDLLIDSDGNIIIPEPEEPKETLPNLTYTVSKKWHPKLASNIAQYNLYCKWDAAEYEVYSSNPADYYVEAYANTVGDPSSNFSDTILVDKVPILTQEISTSIDEVAENLIIQKYGSTLPNAPGSPDVRIPFYILFRTTNGSGTVCSNWHIFFVEPSNGNMITDKGTAIQDDDGNISVEDPDYDNNENVDNSNLNYDPNGGNTSASKNPDSLVYKDNYDPYALYENMKGALATVKDISSMISTCYQWLPSWLLGLIACSIGLLVVVGFIKIVL